MISIMDITAAFIISGRKQMLSIIAPAIEKSITYMHNFRLAMSALSTESDIASEVDMRLTLSFIFLLSQESLSANLLGMLRILFLLFCAKLQKKYVFTFLLIHKPHLCKSYYYHCGECRKHKRYNYSFCKRFIAKTAYTYIAYHEHRAYIVADWR